MGQTRPLWALIAILAAFFVVSAVFAAKLDRFPGDLAFSLWVQSLRAPWFELLAAAISIEQNKLIILSLMVLTVVGLFLSGWRKETYLLLGSTLSGAIAVEIAKELIARPRPSADFALVLQDVSSYSYPSGNAALLGLFLIAVAVSVTGRVGRRRTAIATWIAAVMLLCFVGTSRVYLGAHWLSDILSGYLLALAWVLLALNISTALQALTIKTR